ncbi:MAG: M23 family metallopeptidase [Candidatus Riflebacteria bacterium]|nr:M23 family metallopeptidase [Candidatus Riflebacteria bacterium]
MIQKHISYNGHKSAKSFQFAILLIFLLSQIAILCGGNAAFASGLRWPLDIEISPSGSYGEFRGLRFHTGTDLRTRKQTGFPVKAISDGFVSRIKIQHRGFGYAIYIDHPALGIRSVCGHLEGFAGKVGEYAKSKLEKMGAFYGIDDSFSDARFPVKKGQIVGYSGETGLGPPHLHFELRKLNDDTISPSVAGYKIPDKILPEILAIYFEPFSFDTRINGHFARFSLKPEKKSAKLFVWKNPVTIIGSAGIKIGLTDLAEGGNVLGADNVKLFLDRKLVFERAFNTISYNENNEAPYVFDYHLCQKKGTGSVYNLFKWPFEKNSISSEYKKFEGSLYFETSGTHDIEIVVRDSGGNEVTASGQIEYLTGIVQPPSDKSKTTGLHFNCMGITSRFRSDENAETATISFKIAGSTEKTFPVICNEGICEAAFPYSKDLQNGVFHKGTPVLPPLSYVDSKGGEAALNKSIRAIFPAESVNLPVLAGFSEVSKEIKTQLKKCSKIWTFSPDEILLGKPVTIEIYDIAASISRKLGVYSVNSTGNVSHEGGTTGTDCIKFSSRTIPTLTVLEDSICPTISYLGTRNTKHYGKVWAYKVGDIGEGVDDEGYSILINGTKARFDTDPDKSELYVVRPSETKSEKKAGKSAIEITVTDSAGNKTTIREKR